METQGMQFASLVEGVSDEFAFYIVETDVMGKKEGQYEF